MGLDINLNTSKIDISEDDGLNVDLYGDNVSISEDDSDDIIIEITGLKSINKFIGLEDTPLYYDNGKFFKVENNKIIYTDIEWSDISGDLNDAPEIVALIQKLIETTADTIVNNYIHLHNIDQEAHPYIQNIIQENYNVLNEKIDNSQEELSQDITSLTGALDREIEERQATDSLLSENLQEETLARIDAQTSLHNDISNLNTLLEDEVTARTEGDSSLENSLGALTDELLQEISNRQTQDNALQGQITSNFDTLNEKITTESNNRVESDTLLQNNIDTLANNVDSLSLTVSNNYTTLDNKINSTKTELEGDIDTLSTTVTNNYNDLSGSITSNVATLNNRIDSEVSTLNTAISTETTNRQNADNNLQSQIDAITASSDVTDIVGTYAQLQAYDTSTLAPNSIIKVLQDEHQNNETTYYRWVITGGVGAWVLIGEEGPFYTKSEADNEFVPQTRTVNGKSLSTNVVLTATDVNALPNTTVIGDGILSVQKNGTTIDTFSANATENKSINITVPTDTSDLTNNAGFITSEDLPTVNNGTLDIQVNGTSVGTFTANQSGNTTANIIVPDSATWGNITGDIADQTDLQDALDDKQETLVAGDYIDIKEPVTILVPTGYTQLEYIYSGSSANIVTPLTGDIKWEITAQGNPPYPTTRFLVSRTNSTTGYAWFGSSGSFWGCAGGDVNNISVATKADIVLNFSGTTISGTVNGEEFTYTATSTINGNWTLFGAPNGTGYKFYGYLFSAKATQNGNVVFNGIPCRRDSDNVCGLYDIVNNTFYPSNSSAFSGGSVAYDKPVISADVGNATLTVQRYGSTLATFTSNAKSNVNCNLNPTLSPKEIGTGSIVNSSTTKYANSLCFCGNDNLVHSYTETTVPISLAYGMFVNTSQLSANILSTWYYKAEKCSWTVPTALRTFTSKHKVWAKCTYPDENGRVYFSTLVGQNGNTNTLTGGFTYYYLGVANTASIIALDTTGSHFLSIDTNGKLTHIDGVEIKDDAGGGGTVDQTYDATSQNAQSGVAINGAGFLTGISSSDVTTALGYTPYDSSNPNGYTSNVGTVTSVNNVQPVNGNVTISIPTVPTNISAFTNDSGYITSSALTGYATQSWVGQQGYITGIGSTDVTTALGYTPYNSSNPNGYTSNVGTVTSVNNTEPDTNGNVSISIPSAVTESTVAGWGFTKNAGTVTSVNNIQPINGNVTIDISDSVIWGNITGDIIDQTDLKDILDDKQDVLTAQDGITLTNNVISGSILQEEISSINNLIPTQATVQNQLADKAFVNSSISSNTSNFIGTFNSVSELESYAGTLTNNDYAFVSTTDSAGNTLYDRYKWNGSEWLFEYELNNSSFTASQWNSINSGITSNDVTLISTAIQPNDNISSLTNDAGFITSASLPTVNNSSISIQKNGVGIGSFTLNQSSNKTINISVPTNTSDLTNDAGFITGITNTDITTALGYTPYNATNPNGYTSNKGTVTSVNNVQPVNGNVTIAIPTVPTDISSFNNDSGYITSSALNGYATQGWVGEQGYITEISSTDITTALGYTPYNSSNPNGYTSNVGTVTSVNNVQPVNGNVTLSIPSVGNGTVTFTQGGVTKGSITMNQSGNSTIELDAGGTVDQTFDSTSQNAQSGVAIANAGFLTGITSSDVTTALGYTPYNSSNPSGYITSSDLPTNHVTTDTDQDITGVKTFVGQKRIAFKQSGSSDKLGFTLFNNSGTEKGYLEYNPSNTVDSVPLMTLGNYATASAGLAHVGFRKYSNISGANGAYNLLTPLISDAKTPFNLTTTYTNFYMPLGFTDGNSTVKTAKSGLVDLSSILPTVPTNISAFTNDSGYITGITNSDVTTALGYTPYNSTNPNGYTSNKGTVTSVNNIQPVNGNVTISIPDVSNFVTNSSLETTLSDYVKSSAENTTQGTTASIGYLNGFAPTMQLTYGNYQMLCGCGEGAMLSIIDTTTNTQTSISAIPAGIAIKQGQQLALLSLSNNNLVVNNNEMATQTWVGQQGYLTSSSIANMQTTGNLVTSISSSSTDSQYPSAKCMYDIIGDIETLLQAV